MALQLYLIFLIPAPPVESLRFLSILTWYVSQNKPLDSQNLSQSK